MKSPEVASGAPERGTLSGRTARAASWAVGAQLIAKVTDLVTLLVLARILSPEDFGLVAMAMTAVLVTEAITELPLAQALVRVEIATDSMYDTAFTLALARGAIVATVLVSLSWPLAAFFEEPRIQLLSCALAFAPVLRGLASPRTALYMRAMDFRPEFAMLVVGRSCTLAGACAVALLTGSYWAIAVGTLVDPAVRLVLSYALYPYRPRLRLDDWPVFADIVGWNGLSQLFSALNWQMGRIVLGRLVDAPALGLYTMATTIVALPQQALLAPLAKPLMSAFSAARRRDVMTSACLQATWVLVAAGAPCLLVLICLARPLVTSVLGPDWEASATLVRWEAFAVLLALPLGVLAPLAMSLDRTRYVTLRNAIEFALTLPFMLVAIHAYGVVGAVQARVAAAVVLLGVNLWIVRRLLGIGFRAQALNLARPVIALLPMLAVLQAGNALLPLEAHGLLLAAGTGAVACAGLGTYAAALVLGWRIAGSPAGPEARFFDRYALAVRRRGA